MHLGRPIHERRPDAVASSLRLDHRRALVRARFRFGPETRLALLAGERLVARLDGGAAADGRTIAASLADLGLADVPLLAVLYLVEDIVVPVVETAHARTRDGVRIAVAGALRVRIGEPALFTASELVGRDHYARAAFERDVADLARPAFVRGVAEQPVDLPWRSPGRAARVLAADVHRELARDLERRGLELGGCERLRFTFPGTAAEALREHEETAALAGLARMIHEGPSRGRSRRVNLLRTQRRAAQAYSNGPSMNEIESTQRVRPSVAFGSGRLGRPLQDIREPSAGLAGARGPRPAPDARRPGPTTAAAIPGDDPRHGSSTAAGIPGDDPRHGSSSAAGNDTAGDATASWRTDVPRAPRDLFALDASRQRTLVTELSSTRALSGWSTTEVLLGARLGSPAVAAALSELGRILDAPAKAGAAGLEAPPRPALPAAAAGPTVAPARRATAPWADELDRVLARELGLERFTSAPPEPWQVCASLDELLELTLPLVGAGPAARRVARERLVAEATRAADEGPGGGGGTLGLSLPGRGCFLNGWLIARWSGVADPATVLDDPRCRRLVATTLVHERHGHGWLARATVSGRELGRVEGARHALAERLGLLAVGSEDARAALGEERWRILFHSRKLTEEGYATWLEERATGWLGLAPAAARPGLAELARAAGDLARETSTPGLAEVERALVRLARPEPGQGTQAARTLLVLARPEVEAALDAVLHARFGRGLRYLVGAGLIDTLEERVGTRNVPVALALAGNVRYDLEHIAGADLERLVTRDPRWAVDGRLVELTALPFPEAPVTAATLVDLAHAHLGIPAPDDLDLDLDVAR